MALQMPNQMAGSPGIPPVAGVSPLQPGVSPVLSALGGGGNMLGPPRGANPVLPPAHQVLAAHLAGQPQAPMFPPPPATPAMGAPMPHPDLSANIFRAFATHTGRIPTFSEYLSARAPALASLLGALHR